MCDFQAQNTPKCVRGQVTEFPRPPNSFSGSHFAARDGREKGEKEEKEENGSG